MNLEKIAVATDFTENSLPALEAAFGLLSEVTDRLYLIHVVEVPATATPPMATMLPPIDQLYRAAEVRLAGLIPENWERDVDVETVVLSGSPATAISDFAREKKVDMIVVGTHGRKGLARVLMGSTAEILLREAPCQVLVVKPKSVAPHVAPKSEQEAKSPA